MRRNSKTILLADDLSSETVQDRNRSHALRDCAKILAEKLASPIECFYVEDLTLYPVTHPVYRSYIKNLVTKRKAKLKAVARSLNKSARATFLEGYPAQKTIELCSKTSKYQLLILGSHGRKGLKRAILGSVAEEVVRKSKIPVLILGPHAQGRAKFFSQKPIRIMVATDLSKFAQKAEKYAMSLAQQMSAHVVFFHSLLGGTYPSIGPAFTAGNFQASIDYLIEDFRPQASKELKRKVASFKRDGISASSVIDERSLNPSQAILNQINKFKPDLLIMGTHARSFASGIFLGSTARDMILNSPIPVIVVRPN